MISILTGAGYSMWAWLGPWIIKRGVILGCIAAGLVIWQANNAIERAKGRNQVVQASKQAGAERNEQVRQIRRRIDRSTAWDRLRREYARGD